MTVQRSALTDNRPLCSLQPLPLEAAASLGTETVQQLMVDVRADLMRALSEPFRQVTLDQGIVCIEFIGVLRFVSDTKSRTLTQHMSDEPGSWWPLRADFDLYRPLNSRLWLTLFICLWINRRQPDMATATFVSLSSWMHRCLRRELMSLHLQSALNRTAVQYFAQADLLNQEAHFLAMTSQPKHRPAILDSRRYNLTWQQMPLLRQTADESPTLLPLLQLGLLEGRVSAKGGVSQLKQIMRELGLSQSGWKLLCQWGEDLYYGLKRAPEGSLTLANIANHVSLFAKASPTCFPPRALQRALYMLDTLESEQIIKLPAQFIRHAWDAFNQHRRTNTQALFIKEEFLPLLMWVRSISPDFDKNQRRAGWQFWLNAYEDWVEQRCEIDYRNIWRIASRLKPISHGNCLALPITNTLSLIEEGESMHNCVADLAEECADSSYLVFSIRDKASMQHIATLGLTLSDQLWTIDQVKGIGNSRVGLNIRRVAIEVCNRVMSLDR